MEKLGGGDIIKNRYIGTKLQRYRDTKGQRDMAKGKRKDKKAEAEEPFDVFLSHNSQDKPIVKQLGEELKKYGLRVWLDEWELVPGRPWQEALEEIIETTKTAAVLVGKDGLGPWEIPEMRGCLSEFVDRKMPVIPVLLPGASKKPKLPLFLKQFTWVDLRKGLTKDGIDQLVWGITGSRPGKKTKVMKAAQGPVHNLPYVSIEDLFTGRGEIMEELRAQVAGEKATAITQAIAGLGGIGKSRLAVEFGWWGLNNKKYGHVFFVSSETAELLSASIGRLATGVLGIAPGDTKEEDARQVALAWLGQNDGWLMIIDNADSKEAAESVEKLLPQLSQGQVIITSRYMRWGAAVRPRRLGLFEPQEAKRFLLERTKGRRIETEADEELAEELAAELGYLPLALEQAGAYIAHNGCSMAEYIEEWEDQREKVLKWYDKREMQYPASVAVTYERTFERLTVGARALLRLSAYLAPEEIPTAMFEEGSEIVTEAMKLMDEDSEAEFVCKDAVAELAAYSMITREEKGFAVHRIVQEVVRGRMEKGERKEWIEKALQIVDDYVPTDSDDVRTWPIMDVIRPHVEVIARTADEAGISEPTLRLMGELDNYLSAKGLYGEAEVWSCRALEMGEAVLGPEHQDVAAYLNNLAQLLQNTNRSGEAEPMFRRALEIEKAAYGTESSEVATGLNNLAELLRETERFDEAEPMYRRALKIGETNLGKEHPKVAIYLNNLALLLKQNGCLKEAEPLMQRALEIWEKALGPKHPNVGSVLNNLSELLRETGRFEEAEPMMRRALKIDEAAFGPNHPSVARDLNNLALLLRTTNRLGEAEEMYRRAVKIYEDSLGAGHPTTQTVKDNLEVLLKERRQSR